MNLDFLKLGGISNDAVKLLESPPFAFGRALLLSVAGAYLLRDHLREGGMAKGG